MAISLSELTGASTSGNVLNEVNSYADFLDSVPRLVNKADPSGDTDAVQTTATNQPKALPLIDGDGYLYLPSVAGNYASTPDDSSLDITGDITLECDFIVPEFPVSNDRVLIAKYNVSTNNRSYVIILNPSGAIYLTISQDGLFNQAFQKGVDFSSVLSGKTRATIKATWRQSDGRAQFFIKESDGSFTQVGSNQTIAATSIYNSNQKVEIGTINNGSSTFGVSLGVFSARIYASVDGTDKRLDVDFTSPRIPHGAREFTCETGQVVTVNQSGNDPATIIKKPVLRFDGNDDFMNGLLGQTVTGCYMFAAFSVNGDGGDPSFNRILGMNSSGLFDYQLSGVAFRRNYTSNGLMIRYNGNNIITHSNFFDDERGDYLLEAKVQNASQQSKVNNADADNGIGTVTGQLSVEEFSVAADTNGDNNGSIDLEYLAVFPASLSDSQADQIRNFINNRNRVFSLIDSQGYYFFDGAATDDGQVFTGSGSWNGRIVGSDNGDSDFYINQNTLDDRPTTDGYKITFADNTDHFDIPSTTQAGWQVVGTSLGTFAYKVNANAVTELNLLGNFGASNSRKAGDLYGIILLPESATARDIEEARRLLINRGASDGASVSDSSKNWYTRRDIVEFKPVDMSNVTNAVSAWNDCTSLTSFSTELPEATNVRYAWYNNTSLSSFTTTDIKNCSNFLSAWQNCSSLTSFPADAKLGTEVTGSVDFSNAWRESGLKSFSTPLPTATSVYAAWYAIPELTNFNVESLPLVTDSRFSWYNTGITNFSTALPKANQLFQTWYLCDLLTDFSADVFADWNPSSITSSVFGNAWAGCTSLTAQSVENILVPIANSGKWATTSGLEGGTALTDATIDIDYKAVDPNNPAITYPLTAATLSAIETLNGRGWSVNINGVIQ